MASLEKPVTLTLDCRGFSILESQEHMRRELKPSCSVMVPGDGAGGHACLPAIVSDTISPAELRHALCGLMPESRGRLEAGSHNDQRELSDYRSKVARKS
jgi:hypothetical protein